jgi:hypothetical protein
MRSYKETMANITENYQNPLELHILKLKMERQHSEHKEMIMQEINNTYNSSQIKSDKMAIEAMLIEQMDDG